MLSERELHSRYEIHLENYKKTVTIEAQLTIQIAQRMIIPAAIRYQAEVAGSLAALKAAGVAAPKAQSDLLTELTSTLSEIQTRTAARSKTSDEHAGGAGTHQVQTRVIGGATADDHRDRRQLANELLEVERWAALVARDVLGGDDGALDHEDVQSGLERHLVVGTHLLGGERGGGDTTPSSAAPRSGRSKR